MFDKKIDQIYSRRLLSMASVLPAKSSAYVTLVQELWISCTLQPNAVPQKNDKKLPQGRISRRLNKTVPQGCQSRLIVAQIRRAGKSA